MTNSDEELRDRCKYVEKKLSMSKSNIEEIRGDISKTQRLYRGLGNHTSTLGACGLRHDDCQSARDWYCRSALYWREYLRCSRQGKKVLSTAAKKRIGRHTLRGLSAAVLSGHQRLITEVSQDVLDGSENYKAWYTGDGEHWEYWKGCFWQACTLAALCQDDLDGARGYREQYLAVYDEQDHPVTPTLHEALFETDLTGTRASIEDLLAEHAAQSADIDEWDEFVCRPAAAHLLVARSRGMDVQATEFDSEFLPDTLDQYDIGDPLILPRPEYVGELRIPED